MVKEVYQEIRLAILFWAVKFLLNIFDNLYINNIDLKTVYQTIIILLVSNLRVMSVIFFVAYINVLICEFVNFTFRW